MKEYPNLKPFKNGYDPRRCKGRTKGSYNRKTILAAFFQVMDEIEAKKGSGRTKQSRRA